MPKLVLPSLKYKKRFLKYQGEQYAKTYKDFGFTSENISKRFPYLLKLWSQHKKGQNLPKIWVPYTMFFLVAGYKYLGQTSVRHKLDKYLRKVGGHIGYEIAPDQRKKGYGTLILNLALRKAKKLGIDKILVTCSENNIGSKKIIEKNGGKFVGKNWDEKEKVFKLRFWIAIF